MGFSVSGSLDSILASFQAELDALSTEENEDNAANDALYTGYYDKATKGKTGDIPTEALQNMANDENCSAAVRETINAELEKRGEEPILSEKENHALYDDYYDNARAGNVSNIPTSALKNMANDETCSDLARSNINKELVARGQEPILSEKDNNLLYDDYYDKARAGNVKDIPTSALQTLAGQSTCSDLARDNINKELIARNEEPFLSEDANDKLYQGYYDSACANDVKHIPTSALKNMASDEDCSDEARDNINKELEARGEVPIEL
ncbi:MAG: hypothetical protein ACRYF5_01235 [Janthinobacterium lividum]